MKIYKTPRLLVADAYTIGSNKFESDKAKEKSVYYVTFRRNLNKINPDLYDSGDDRYVFCGLQRIVERLFLEPITHKEIDEAIEFLKYAKVTSKGFVNYDCPEELWREVVDKYNGFPPIEILAFPEGSVVYPNEPVIQVTSLVNGMGILGAWFESKILQVWSATERVTQNEHLFKYFKNTIKSIDSNLSCDEVEFLASIMITDFGDRASICEQESEELGMYHLLTFSGTDTFCGAYQAYKNSDPNNVIGLFSSVNALAHRNVQSYDVENDCYEAIYNSCDDNEIISMVNDCYSSKKSVKEYHVPLALRSIKENNGKVVVSRADSGDAEEEMLYIINCAIEAGLYEEKNINGEIWKCGTTLKFLCGDGLNFGRIKELINVLIKHKFLPYSWGLFGMGGGFRNHLKRDNSSAKYALCSIGNDNVPVMKFSNSAGKVTIPSIFKVLRSKSALMHYKTIIMQDEVGEDARVVYYNGLLGKNRFGVGYEDSFTTIKNRLRFGFDKMPPTLETQYNHNYPISDKILEEKNKLFNKYINI